jgi:hypothetical protein
MDHEPRTIWFCFAAPLVGLNPGNRLHQLAFRLSVPRCFFKAKRDRASWCN